MGEPSINLDHHLRLRRLVQQYLTFCKNSDTDQADLWGRKVAHECGKLGYNWSQTVALLDVVRDVS